MKFTFMRVALVGLLVAPGAVMLTPAWGATTECGVFSRTPFKATNSSVGAQGGRNGCINRVSVQSSLKYDRFGPDPEVGHNGGNEVNVTWTVYGCGGNQSYYLTTFSAEGQSAGSANKTISVTC